MDGVGCYFHSWVFCVAMKTIPEIVERIRGKFPEMIWMAKEYSKADMIADLLEIEKQHNKKSRKKK